jgi:hypothetical protein
MKALAFWKAVTMDTSDLLERVLTILSEPGIRFCVIGGQAVNAYVEPLVSLDLDLAVAIDQIAHVRKAMQESFTVEEFPHSLNVSSPGSNLRVQIQTDPRYSEFVSRASAREVLGLSLSVATIEDVLQGKIWAASDRDHRATKRRKDLLDIARILEANPRLKSRVPAEILREIG